MTIKLPDTLPEYPKFDETRRRAPDRGYRLTKAQTELALRNALRYVPENLHAQLAPEFLEELRTRGRIYAYRYRPEGRIWGKPIEQYQGKCIEGKAFQVMIDNNLDFETALYPYELVTYGETGQPCQNWLQYRLIKLYLEQLTDHQTLVLESGHPLGLFPSRPEAPRVILTNALMVGMGRGARCGSVEQGKRADLVVWDAADLETLCYRLGSNLARTVICKGEIV